VLVSEWAATCPRCGTDVSAAPVAEGVREADVAAPRRGRRWRVPAIVAVAVAVGAAAALGAATGGPSRPRASPATVLDSLPYASTVGRYLPPSREQGDGVVVPVTLLDGRRFELAFPASLAVIASLGVAVEDSITVGAANPVVLRVIATRATVAQVFGSAHPRRSYAGPEGGRVLVFDGPPGSSTSYLVFRFGPWLLSVLDAGDHPGRPRIPNAAAKSSSPSHSPSRSRISTASGRGRLPEYLASIAAAISGSGSGQGTGCTHMTYPILRPGRRTGHAQRRPQAGSWLLSTARAGQVHQSVTN